MLDIIQMLSMSKKEVKQYLKEKGVAFSKNKFTAGFFERESIFEINFEKNAVYSIDIDFSDRVIKPDAYIKQFKDSCTGLGFSPESDNTNHASQNYQVLYQKEGIYACMYATEKELSRWGISFTFHAKSLPVVLKESEQIYVPIFSILFMVIGFFLAVALHVTKEDTSAYFYISLAISWCVISLLWLGNWLANRCSKNAFKEKNYQNLLILMGDHSSEKLYKGKLNRTHAAWLTVSEDGVVIYFKGGKQFLSQALSLEEIEYHLTYKNILCSTKEDDYYWFEFSDEEERNEVCSICDEKLGYHSVEYRTLFDDIQNILIAYDANSFFAIRGYKFEKETDIIARAFYKKKIHDKYELEALICNAFDQDNSFSHDLAELIPLKEK